MLRLLPNLLTLLNLFSGCLAIVFISIDAPLRAIFCVGFAQLFDFLDGAIARALHIQDPIGKELDSLADEVSFGVVPGLMYYQMIGGLALPESLFFLPYFGFVFTLFGAYRLARFNVLQSQQTYFSGLPIPSAALFVVGLYWISHSESCHSCASAFINPYVLLLSVIFLSYLMVSQLPHFSFKMKKLTWRGYEIQWIFLMLVIILVFVLQEAAVSLSVVLYIFLSLVHFALKPSLPS